MNTKINEYTHLKQIKRLSRTRNLWTIAIDNSHTCYTFQFHFSREYSINSLARDMVRKLKHNKTTMNESVKAHLEECHKHYKNAQRRSAYLLRKLTRDKKKGEWRCLG